MGCDLEQSAVSRLPTRSVLLNPTLSWWKGTPDLDWLASGNKASSGRGGTVVTQLDATPSRCDAPSMLAASWMADGARVGHSQGCLVEFQGGIEAASPPSRRRAQSGRTSAGDALWRSWRRRSVCTSWSPARLGTRAGTERGLLWNVLRRATVHQRIERRRSSASWRPSPSCCVKDRRSSRENCHGRPGRQGEPLGRRRGALCATGVAAISAD